jgi:salicylate hydroxylase
MLPFRAQGAAQAMEDGATLAACLSQVDADGVPEALHRYETLRLPRATCIQALCATNKIRFHLPDGPAQAERDAEWRAAALIGLAAPGCTRMTRPSRRPV